MKRAAGSRRQTEEIKQPEMNANGRELKAFVPSVLALAAAWRKLLLSISVYSRAFAARFSSSLTAGP